MASGKHQDYENYADKIFVHSYEDGDTTVHTWEVDPLWTDYCEYMRMDIYKEAKTQFENMKSEADGFVAREHEYIADINILKSQLKKQKEAAESALRTEYLDLTQKYEFVWNEHQALVSRLIEEWDKIKELVATSKRLQIGLGEEIDKCIALEVRNKRLEEVYANSLGENGRLRKLLVDNGINYTNTQEQI